MKIVVTGASGFIGKNFLLHAPKDWDIYGLYFSSTNFLDFLKTNDLENVKPIKADLSDYGETQKLIDKLEGQVDTVLYLAANSDPAVSVKNPSIDIKLNTSALVNFFSNFKCNKVIFFSSGAVYDGLEGLVNPESKLNPLLPYSISKLASEQYIKYFAEKKQTIKSYFIVRFFGAFGPYEPARKIYTKLIRQIYFEDKNEFTIKGNGENYIDAIYIDDAVQGILSMINSQKKRRIIDFGTGNPIKINELVKRTAKVFGKEDLKINYEGEVPEHIRFKILPGSFEKEFSFGRRVTLEEGIKRFAEFLKKDYL